jgi:hypothetical protein
VRSFRRSSVFGIVGVFVVAGACAAIALTMGQGQAKPKGALALIFGVIGVYLVLLFLFQSRDLRGAEAADADAAGAADGGPAATVANPAVLDDSQLWAFLAIHPIDSDAARARQEAWGMARTSIRTAMLVCVLIFLAVPPIYLLDTWVPLMIGGPLIAGVALWRSVRLLAGGGDLDHAFELTSRAMGPLGLAVTDRYRVTIEPRFIAPLRMGPRIRGALVLSGERHGRAVSVRMPATEGVRSVSSVRVEVRAPSFSLRSRDGRVVAGKEAPPDVRAALKSVPASTRWNGVHGHAGPDGIELERKGGGGSGSLLDLWIAERIAAAVGPESPPPPV